MERDSVRLEDITLIDKYKLEPNLGGINYVR